ncbi:MULTISPECIES: relaxase/mobilization nuclease domain-containing protein [Prevotella]|uniref:Mobilization protein n=1 Tax=Prevotella intermedia TaxID=28131 RepID=A0AAJ3RKQ7_PREIN|nr:MULTISPECIES: relaxase/mobilization nuclease domain-containing protein [Prevotella]PIK18616.1 mobilization protein [Prevotella intermedia]QUB52324.1 relaxase/mobilization nuclease domain-containing protein [Prevotella nigrescens]SES71880.1 Relaxase/Mobilisation nuclease domain-containing protein [Prevotella sp. kh1p2]SNU10441.1 Relaxase/Mobilisation nuclease domain-containing protein [Prevotellaceae bacterium KH2P17]
MIGKCKAIAHGSTALDYIFREGKLGNRLAFHNLCSREPKAIYEEMKVVSDYNSRCRNKFLRIEIGIAPQDEKKLPVSELMRIAHLFAKQMGLNNHQWVAVTHKDTDNRHIHIIANRISLYGEVYDTTFVSNRAARVAEEISREENLTIAKEVKTDKKYQKEKSNPTREQTKKEVQQICYALLDKYKGTGITGHSMFLYELNKNGIAIDRMKNKQGNVYGLKFSCAGQSFKASEIGREFGYHSLQKNFETTNKEESRKPHLTVQEPTERKEQPDKGYQLVPPSCSSISRANDTPQVQNSIGAVADTIVGAADELMEGLGDLITPTAQGNDYAEAAWQRKLRNQANRKKKRGRGI